MGNTAFSLSSAAKCSTGKKRTAQLPDPPGYINKKWGCLDKSPKKIKSQPWKRLAFVV